MRDGYVYLIRSLRLGWIKIGWAKDIARRMVEVASMAGTDLELVGSFRGTQREEHDLQDRFREDRIAYDWFTASAGLMLFATGLPPIVRISFVGAPHTNDVFFRSRLAGASHSRVGPHIGLATAARPSRDSDSS